jgi:hypothetical protein
MTEFLHELVKKQEWNAHVRELLESDPWRYSEPPAPLTLQQDTSWDTEEGPY